MALTKSSSARSIVSSQSCSAGGTVASASGFEIGYGVSILATITNGATGPTVECQVRVDFSADGTTWNTGYVIGGGGTTANAVTRIGWSLAPAGGGGDWAYYRLVFTGNTGQAVTVAAVDSTTTAIV